MKLFKRLLPIATASAAAVAAITPLATSCGTKADYDFITDGSSIYIPTIEKAKADWAKHPYGYTREEAEALYFESIATNPEIYYEDVKAALSCAAYYFVEYSPMVNFSADLSEIKVDAQNRTISLSGKFSFHARTIPLNLTKFAKYVSGDIDIEFKLTNAPCYLSYEVESKVVPFSGWFFLPGSPIDNASVKPSIDIYANGSLWAEPMGPASFCKFDNEEISVESQEDIEKLDYKWACAAALITLSSFVMGSYHLANIEYDDPESRCK